MPRLQSYHLSNLPSKWAQFPECVILPLTSVRAFVWTNIRGARSSENGERLKIGLNSLWKKKEQESSLNFPFSPRRCHPKKLFRREREREREREWLFFSSKLGHSTLTKRRKRDIICLANFSSLAALLSLFLFSLSLTVCLVGSFFISLFLYFSGKKKKTISLQNTHCKRTLLPQINEFPFYRCLIFPSFFCQTVRIFFEQ